MAVDSQFQVVHELTVGKSTYEACQTKVRRDWYVALDGTLVLDTMSKDCRNFYLWESKECAGCEYPKDTEYAERMKGME